MWLNDALYLVFLNKNQVPFLTKIEESGTPNQPTGLAWNDIVAHGDLGLRKAIGHYYKKGQPVSADESQDFFKRFIPWRHMVGYYLLMDHIENGKNYVTSI